MRKSFASSGLALVALCTLPVLAHADEEKVSPKNLPSGIKKAIEKKYPKAEIERAVKEVENGNTAYEVLLEIEDHPFEVKFDAAGSILEVEKVISHEQLPARVKKVLSKKYPKAKIERIEAVTKGEKGPTTYEIVIKTEVVINGDGKLVKATEEEDESPSAKAKPAKKAKKHEDGDDDDEDGDDDDHEKGKKGKKD
jgi:hypothetical protein